MNRCSRFRMNGLCPPSVPRPSSIPGVVLIMYVTLLSLCIHAVYRQQRCRVRHYPFPKRFSQHCQSIRSPSFPPAAHVRGSMLRPVLQLLLSSPQTSDLCFMGAMCCWTSPNVNQRAMPPMAEIQYFAMPITYAKKGREMRPKCVALTGAGVQTRHHPNFKSRSATSSFQCRFHSTAPFVNSVFVLRPHKPLRGLNLRFPVRTEGRVYVRSRAEGFVGSAHFR